MTGSINITILYIAKMNNKDNCFCVEILSLVILPNEKGKGTVVFQLRCFLLYVSY